MNATDLWIVGLQAMKGLNCATRTELCEVMSHRDTFVMAVYAEAVLAYMRFCDDLMGRPRSMPSWPWVSARGSGPTATTSR